jgi:hypothetical protein
MFKSNKCWLLVFTNFKKNAEMLECLEFPENKWSGIDSFTVSQRHQASIGIPASGPVRVWIDQLWFKESL